MLKNQEAYNNLADKLLHSRFIGTSKIQKKSSRDILIVLIFAIATTSIGLFSNTAKTT